MNRLLRFFVLMIARSSSMPEIAHFGLSKIPNITVDFDFPGMLVLWKGFELR